MPALLHKLLLVPVLVLALVPALLLDLVVLVPALLHKLLLVPVLVLVLALVPALLHDLVVLVPALLHNQLLLVPVLVLVLALVPALLHDLVVLVPALLHKLLPVPVLVLVLALVPALLHDLVVLVPALLHKPLLVPVLVLQPEAAPHDTPRLPPQRIAQHKVLVLVLVLVLALVPALLHDLVVVLVPALLHNLVAGIRPVPRRQPVRLVGVVTDAEHGRRRAIAYGPDRHEPRAHRGSEPTDLGDQLKERLVAALLLQLVPVLVLVLVLRRQRVRGPAPLHDLDLVPSLPRTAAARRALAAGTSRRVRSASGQRCRRSEPGGNGSLGGSSTQGRAGTRAPAWPAPTPKASLARPPGAVPCPHPSDLGPERLRVILASKPRRP